MKKIYLLFLGIFLSTFSFYQVNAQRACGTMQHLEEQMLADPALEQRMQQIEDQSQNWIQHQKKNPTVQAVISIPVVVHVLYNTSTQNISDAQVLSQIDVLNEDYRKLNVDVSNTPSVFAGLAADCQIQFCMASRDPNGNATNGIVRRQTSTTSFSTNDNMKYTSKGGDDAWNSSQYLNIWVCNLGQGLLGYAQFPGGAAATDGVVILYSAFGRVGTVNAPYHKGRTATHEVGHWLNLRHIWGDANCGNDQVTDTPTSQTSNYGCPTFPHVTCSNGPNGDMFMNYMDYTDDLCMFMFTTGQSTRMTASINTSRVGLLTSPGCTAPGGGGTTCAVPSGLSASSITTSSATLSWGSVSGAASYNVNYRIVGSAAWTSSSTASTSIGLSNLSAATNYEFQVQTVCSTTGTSAFSASSTFTTSAVATGCTDVYESNNSTSTAKVIPFNTDINAVIGTSTDNDYYKFTTVTGSTNLKVVLDQLTLDYDLKLLKSNGSTIATSQLSGSSTETIIRNTTTAATYYARVYGYNGAYSTTSCYRLRVNNSSTAFRGSGMEETLGNIVPEKMQGLDALQLFPNPASDNITLSFFTDEETPVTARIIDMLGKEVFSHSMNAEAGFQETSLKTDELPSGVYMLQLKSGADVATKRFVVKH